MDQPLTSFNEAWERFRALDSLRLVPDTLEGEWARGRARFMAFLVPVDDTGVATQIARLLDRLAGIPGVEPYPRSYWHITVKGVGFQAPRPVQADELSPETAEAITAAAHSVFARQPAFDAQLGLASAFEGVVFAEVKDGGRFAAMNAALLERIPALARHEFDVPNFLPHISIARFTSNEGLVQLKAALAELRGGDHGPAFPVQRVDLISTRLSSDAPSFDLMASYDLGGRLPG